MDLCAAASRARREKLVRSRQGPGSYVVAAEVAAAARGAARLLVDLGDDGRADVLDLLELCGREIKLGSA